MTHSVRLTACLLCVIFYRMHLPCSAQGDAVQLPPEVAAVWDLDNAVRETTPTRERICINGLWRWQPSDANTDQLPVTNWGYFKVPGCWPGITDYMQKDCQTVHSHPAWRSRNPGDLSAAWYQREITIPAEWSDRSIILRAEYLNSFADVYVDGKQVGDMRFPRGELELTPHCSPGNRHTLSLRVAAMPLKGIMLSYGDTASAKHVKGRVARRGLCGDVFVESVPKGPRISGVTVATSVRQWEISIDAPVEDLHANSSYILQAEILDGSRTVKAFKSHAFNLADIKDGHVAFSSEWKPVKLWDTHTPQNMYRLSLSLMDGFSRRLDVCHPVRFGFREFWIDGRDFYLNGTRIYLSSVPFDNAQVGAAWANYAGARESLERLQSYGINFVYTHNYDCQPGSHLGFAEILRACDDTGMLIALSQPHCGNYDWQTPDADTSNGYERHAAAYVRTAHNHPSVVAYATSHNATGYAEDMNPDLIDGVHDVRSEWSVNNARKAMRAEAIIRRLDPHRIVYHHASGNLGSMHSSNFYPNFVPVQEMSDWFEHWATDGTKPLFLCEYGAPFTWDWAMYRGWYKGRREFGSAVVPWEFCLAEWNAQFIGDRAYQVSEMERKNLRWEAERFRTGKGWHRWDYPHQLGARDFNERYPIMAMYLTDNWRAFRTWGISATSPWEHGTFWKPRPGLNRNQRTELKTDWQHLQRPGFSPDYMEERYERMDLAYERKDWVATPAAEALLRNNRHMLAYIAGEPAHFTSKDHHFHPGDTVEKQLIVINNSRETVPCACRWSLSVPRASKGEQTLSLPTGQQERIALRFDLPDTLAPGAYTLRASVAFGSGETQQDSFVIHVLPHVPPPQSHDRIALFDPAGETARMLTDQGIAYRAIQPAENLADIDLLIVGKAALTLNGAAPDVSRVRDGLKVIVFEQTAEALQDRLGFRVQEYGLRQVFPRVTGHPTLRGLESDNLCNWRGEATILSPRLAYELSPRFNYVPTVIWCGIPVPRLWRCGNRGNVASVLIEKPAIGDFMPILDGGYSLQYSPLMEYREGRGMILFCQMDVTGRTREDPVAAHLVRNIVDYVGTWQPSSRRRTVYTGNHAAKRHLEFAGVKVDIYSGGPLTHDQVLVAAPGAGPVLAQHAPDVVRWLESGGHLLALELDAGEANTFLPSPIRTRSAEHIAAFFEPFDITSPLAGIGPADVHNRSPRRLPLVCGGSTVVGNGVLAHSQTGHIVFCQLAPYHFGQEPYNLRRTYRRASFMLARLLANMGVAGQTPLLARFPDPAGERSNTTTGAVGRWSNGLYLDQPVEWDDPYRFFRW